MKIDFILDICCLWSYIAWRQLQEAVQECSIQAEITPFFISSGSFFPGFDISPSNKIRMLEEKAHPFLEQAGLFVDFDRLPDLSGDISRSHRLVRSAFAEKKYKVLDELFAAFFAFGRDITDPAVLSSIADYNGLKGYASLPFSTALPANMPEGLRAVPCMIFNQTTIIFGAQSVPCLKNMLRLNNRLQNEEAFLKNSLYI